MGNKILPGLTEKSDLVASYTKPYQNSIVTRLTFRPSATFSIGLVDIIC